jgi:hypothetical protein
MRFKQLFLFTCIGFILFTSACSDKKKDHEETAPKAAVEDIFNYVPADSPYVIGNVIPMPEPYLKKVIETWQKILPVQTRQLEKITARAQKTLKNQSGIIVAKLAKAVLAEMETIKTPGDILLKWGISPKTTGVVYGLGLFPAVRLQISEKQKIEQLLTRLEEKSGQKMLTAEFNGHPYRYIEIKDKIHLKGILAITDKYLIAGLIPGEQAGFNQFLPLLLGTKKPGVALSQSEFTEAISPYHFPGYGDGYVDIRKVAAILRGEGEELNLASYQSLIPEPDFKLQIGCNAEFNRSLFENMPRMVFGFNQLTETAINLEMVLELSAGLIEILNKLPQSIPDIASQRDPMFAMGIGANIPELRGAIQRLLQFIIENNRDCPDINTDKLKAAIPKLNMALNPMISGFHSIILSLDQMEMGENGQPMMNTASACIAAEMIDPEGILAMAGSFIPSLAKTNISNDGTPAAISLDGLPLNLPGLFVAVKGQRLVLAMGNEASPRVRDAISGKGIADMPLYWMKYQTSTWEQLLKSGLSANKKFKTDDQKMALEFFEQYKDLVKSITGGIYVTDKGLAFRESVLLN